MRPYWYCTTHMKTYQRPRRARPSPVIHERQKLTSTACARKLNFTITWSQKLNYKDMLSKKQIAPTSHPLYRPSDASWYSIRHLSFGEHSSRMPSNHWSICNDDASKKQNAILDMPWQLPELRSNICADAIVYKDFSPGFQASRVVRIQTLEF